METHAALPDLQDLSGSLPDHLRLVEDHIAEPAAENDSQGDPEDQVVDLGGRDRRGLPAANDQIAGQTQGIAPAQQDARNIGQGIPADPELADNRQMDGPAAHKGRDIGKGHGH